MSFLRFALAVLSVALSLCAALPAQAQKRVILEMRKEVAQSVHDRALRDLAKKGLKKAHRYKHLPFVAAEADDEAAVQAAAADPDVVAVHEDRLHRPALAESGPLVGAPQAWDRGFSGAGQHIAILDTGVDRDHPFLRGKVVYEACFSSTYAPYAARTACPNGQDAQIGSGAAAPCSVPACTHGTHVAGIAAGNGASAVPPQPFSGIAKDAGLIAIQVFSVFDSTEICGGGGTPCVAAFTSDLMRALDHVYAIRANYSVASANMSLGGGLYATHCDADPLKAGIDLLRSAGIATVAASGNQGYVDALSAPACISSAVSVGATTKAPEGVAYFTNSAWMLNLLAPGVSIQSSVTGGGYASFSGTSMATPHVAGAFAVLKQKKPAATVDELLTALSATGLPVYDPGNGLSKPRIRVSDALDGVFPVGPVLAVSPADSLSTAGPPGGPFSPASKSYSLTNSGVAALDFSASTPAAWVTLTPPGGTLGPGASTTVAVTINSGAASLPGGVYGSTVQFTNTTNGVGSASRTLALSVEPGPANDRFDDAVALPPSSGNTSGSNVRATKEAGEPSHAGQPGGRSVWWRWTAPASGPVSFDTLGSVFDTVLAAYIGDSVSQLVEIAANDNAPGTTRSRILFTAAQGQTYHIAVDGAAGTAGQIILNWAFGQDVVQPGDITVTPDSGFAASGSSGGPFTPASIVYTLTNVSAAARTFSVTGVPGWLSASPASGRLAPGESTQVALSVHYSAVTLGIGTHSGTVMFNSVPRAVSLTVQGSTGRDNFADASALAGSAVTATGSNVGASSEPGEPQHGGLGGASMWWRWTAPVSGPVIIDTFGSSFDTLLAVYTGSAVNALAFVANNDDSDATVQSRVMFMASAGVEYRIAVDGYSGATGSIKLHIATAPSGGPANNAFAAAIEMSGAPVSASGTNIDATKEPGEPLHAGNAGGASAWWKWTAPATQLVSIDTFGSTFNTLLAVYTGTQVSALNPVASNNDHGGPQSKLTFQALQGTTYFIAVDGYDNGGLGAQTGGIALNLTLATPVGTGTTALVYFSQPGDWIGGGESRQIYADQAGVSIGATRNFQQGVTLAVRAGAEWWNLNLAPPPAAGAPLAPGAYESAVRYPFNSGLSPGMDFSGNHRGCNSIGGRFEVLEAVYGTDGSPQRFAANFVQHCDDAARALFGQIRLNSDVPLDLESALPAPFTFADALDVARNAVITSNTVTLSGFTNAPISVQGGEYSINGGAFTSMPGTIANGQTVALRLMSSSVPGTATYATVKIGAASSTFQATTALAQSGTNILYFHSHPGEYIGQGEQRAFHAGNGWTLRPSGNFSSGVTFSVDGPGFWTLNFAPPRGSKLAAGVYENAASYPTQNGTSPGLSFYGEGRGCSVKGRFEIFEVGYRADGSVQRFAADFVQYGLPFGCPPAPTGLFGQIRYNSDVPIYTEAVLPTPFDFVDAVDVPRGVPVISNGVQISGISSTPISVQGGEYNINGGPFTTAPGTVTNGQIVRLRLLSSNLAGTPAFATVKIGAASATFQATTAIAVQGTDVLYYHSQPGDFIGGGERAALYAGTGWILRPSRNYHNGVSFDIEGNGTWGSIDFAAPGDGAALPLAVGAYENAVRFPFENGASPGLSASVYGGGCNTLRGRFDVLDVAYGADGSVQRFAADFVQHCDGQPVGFFGQIRYKTDVPIYVDPALPAPFDFVDAVDVPRGVPLVSNAVAVSGISSAPIRVQGGEYSIGGGPFTSAPGTIANGQTVALRLMSSNLPAAATFATVWIGAGSATFQATTAVAPGSNVLYLRSTPGDYIGEGKTRSLHAGNGFTFTPSRNFYNGVIFSIQGSGDSWRIDLAAPGNPPTSAPALAPGAYENAMSMPPQAGRAGLNVDGGSRGCTRVAGRFDVLEAVYGAGGTVNAFAANFEQRCDGLSSPLYGRIRYNSSLPLFNVRRDHDGDGRSDILWRNASTGENYLYTMDGTRVLTGEGYLRAVADPNWQIAGTGDFDGDGRADILWRNAATGENYIYLMSGTSIIGEGYLRTVSDLDWKVAGVGDFDGDGRDDILWRNATSGENYVYFMNSLSIANEGYLRTVADTRWEVKGVGDVDGDGKADILWRNSSSGENYVYLMQGTAIRGEGYLRTVADTRWEIKGFGDVDGDGRADIVWRNNATGENYVYLMNRLSIAGEGYLRTVPDPAWQIVAVGDFDGDGKSDILWRNASTGQNYLYPMDGTTIKPSEGFLRTVPAGSWTVVGK